MMRDKTSFSKTTIYLHWMIAIGVICLMSVGIYMDKTETYSLYPIHKSIGTILFIFIIIRVFWRLNRGFPSTLETHANWEVMLAEIAHWVLLIATLLFPISGITMSIMGGNGLDVFGLNLVSANIDAISQESVPLNKGIAVFARQIHGFLANLLIVTIVLHVLGALKHHLVDKDITLKRMLGKD